MNILDLRRGSARDNARIELGGAESSACGKRDAAGRPRPRLGQRRRRRRRRMLKARNALFCCFLFIIKLIIIIIVSTTIPITYFCLPCPFTSPNTTIKKSYHLYYLTHSIIYYYYLIILPHSLCYLTHSVISLTLLSHSL